MSVELPPPELTTRAGGAHEQYEFVARSNRRRIEGLLPEGWAFEGKRILDFGCGAGRSIAVFADLADRAKFVGCDLHAPSIQWAQEHLSPPFEFFLNQADPPLDQPAESFDLVWGVSVFTHVTDNWAAWLAEVHRVLKPGGLALFSFLGEKMWQAVLDEREWDADRVGMTISKPQSPWDHGGPDAFHSEWWLRAHWGRAFDVVHLDHGPPDHAGHGWVVLRRDDRPAPTPAELERPEPGDDREVYAAQTNVALLSDQLRELYAQTARADETSGRLRAQLEQARRENEDLKRRYEIVVNSKSWRVTSPLRQVARRIRER